MSLAVLAVALLALLLLVGRLGDAARVRAQETTWSEILSPHAHDLLDELMLAVAEHRVGLVVLDRAARARDHERLRVAVEVVEGFAPGMREGLAAVACMSRAVSALVPMPAISPVLWSAWQLRGLGFFTLLLHGALVAAAERVRLRLWLLGRALGFCLRGLRRNAAAPVPRWRGVEAALKDLGAVADETTLTYEHVIHALDAVGAIAPAQVPALL